MGKVLVGREYILRNLRLVAGQAYYSQMIGGGGREGYLYKYVLGPYFQVFSVIFLKYENYC